MNDEENFILTWTIKNYSLWRENEGEFIKCPKFVIECLENSKWSLWFLSKNWLGQVKGKASFYLKNITRCKQNVELRMKFEIVDIRGEIIGSETIKSIFSEDLHVIKHHYLEDSIFSKLNNCPEDIFILRYKLKKINNIEKFQTQCEAETNFVTKTHVAIWNIRQYFLFKPDFELTSFSSSKSPLKLHFNTDEDYISIDIQIMDTNSVMPLRVKVKISLLHRKKIEAKSKIDSHVLKSTSDVWRFPNFISKEELHTMEYIKLTFIVHTGEVEHMIKSYTYRDMTTEEPTSSTKIHSSLLSDLRAMHISKRNSDVKLKVGEELLDAHKFILATRSSVFCTMFDQNMSENHSGIYKITDVDDDILKILVEYIYTDSVEFEDFERAFKLLMAAHRYKILSLVDKCAFFLAAILEIDNVLEIVEAADMIGHDLLKRAAIDFINDKAKTILSLPTWIPWFKNNVALGSEIVTKLSKKIEEVLRRI